MEESLHLVVRFIFYYIIYLILKTHYQFYLYDRHMLREISYNLNSLKKQRIEINSVHDQDATKKSLKVASNRIYQEIQPQLFSGTVANELFFRVSLRNFSSMNAHEKMTKLRIQLGQLNRQILNILNFFGSQSLFMYLF